MKHLANDKAKELLSEKGKEKLAELSECVEVYSFTSELKIALQEAIDNADKQLVASLNALAEITSKLVIHGRPVDISQYPFQGKEELYILLDRIRFCFKELVWAANDAGYEIKDNKAFNNNIGIS